MIVVPAYWRLIAPALYPVPVDGVVVADDPQALTVPTITRLPMATPSTFLFTLAPPLIVIVHVFAIG